MRNTDLIYKEKEYVTELVKNTLAANDGLQENNEANNMLALCNIKQREV